MTEKPRFIVACQTPECDQYREFARRPSEHEIAHARCIMCKLDMMKHRAQSPRKKLKRKSVHKSAMTGLYTNDELNKPIRA